MKTELLRNKKLLIGGGAALIVIIAVIIALLLPKTITMYPGAYVSVTTEGLNGEGTASLEFDEAGFLEAVRTEKKLSEKKETDLLTILSSLEKYFILSKSNGLSNDETIIVSHTIPTDLLKKYQIELAPEGAEVTVAGLTEIQIIQLSDYHTSEFSGYNGHASMYYGLDYEAVYDAAKTAILAVEDSTASRDYIDENLWSDLYTYIDGVSAEFSDALSNGSLSNGDVIPLTFTVNPVKHRIDAYGVTFEGGTAAVEVNRLEEVITLHAADYFIPEYRGYNGWALADTTIDTDKLAADIETEFSAKRADFDLDYVMDELLASLNYEIDEVLSKTEEISNGDAITLTTWARYDTETVYNSYVGVELLPGEATHTAEGIEEAITIALEDYLTASVTGYNTIGTLALELDRETLKSDLAGLIPETRNGYTAEEVYDEVAGYISYYADIYADRDSNLSNGDICTVSVDWSRSTYLSYVGVNLIFGEKVITVTDLPDAEEADLTELLTITFSGVCPNVKVSYAVDNEHPLSPYLDWNSIYSIPSQIVAHNGDTLEITLSCNAEKALYAGYNIVNTTKTFEVAGLDTYDYMLTSIEDEFIQTCAESQKDSIHKAVMDRQDALIRDLNSDTGHILWSLSDIALDRVVRAYAEQTASHSLNNRTAFVYQITVPFMDKDNQITMSNVYVISCVDNAQQTTDGTITWADTKRSDIYYSSESVEEALAELPNSFSMQNDTEAVITELVNEAAADELAWDPTELPIQIFTGSNVELAALEIPEISSDAAASAVAFTEYDGNRYYLFDQAMTWEEAKEFCESAGGHLVSITTRTEQDVVMHLAEQGTQSNYWIGAYDQESESHWTWTTGEAFSYSYWESGEPNNTDGVEHYVHLRKSNGRWNDNVLQLESTGFLLEVSAEQDPFAYFSESDAFRLSQDASYHSRPENSFGMIEYGSMVYHANNKDWTEYELNGSCAKMTGVLSVSKDTNTEASIDVAIFGDGRLLYLQTEIGRVTYPIAFEVDLTGVNKLDIRTRNSGNGSAYLMISRGKLYPQTEETTVSNVRQLDDLVWVGGSQVELRDWYSRAVNGFIYPYNIRFTANEGAYQIWNLDGAYSSFSGTFMPAADLNEESLIDARIYGDNQLLFEAAGLSKRSPALDFTVDVTGVKLLKIEVVSQNQAYDSYFFLYGDQLVLAETNSDSAQSEQPQTDKDGQIDPTGEQADSSWEFPAVSAYVMNQSSCMMEFGDHRYYLFEEPLTWKQAERFCRAQGGQLAEISTPSEQCYLEELLSTAVSDWYWIGGTDEAEEGTWLWCSGEAILDTNWQSGQPDNCKQGEFFEHYLQIKSANGTWNDADEGKSCGFIMEISPDKSVPKTNLELAELSDRILEGNDYSYDKYSWDSRGSKVLSVYRLDASRNAWMRYDLNGEFASMTGTVCPYSDAQNDASLNIAFYGDGQLLYECKGIRGTDDSTDFSIDLTGVDSLLILTSNRGGYSNGFLLLSDTHVSLAETPAAELTSAMRLHGMQLVDSSEYSSSFGLSMDTYGNLYFDSSSYNAERNAFSVQLLDGNYTELSGTITMPSSSNSSPLCAITVQIYADDELIFEQTDINKMSGPIPFTLDVTGKKMLKIVASETSEISRDVFVSLNGCVLK